MRTQSYVKSTEILYESPVFAFIFQNYDFYRTLQSLDIL